MRTETLNTYNVTFHYTVQVKAEHEEEALTQAEYHAAQVIDTPVLRQMSDTVELIDGTEAGEEN